MDLTQYVNDLRRQLEVAAEAGGDEARRLAERLTAPLDAASRLVLLEALSDAAGEITRELAPGSVEVRLRGRDPEFVVTQAAATPFQDVAERSAALLPPPSPIDADEGTTSRTTLRLPDQLKARVEEAAARDGVSVNSWLVRVVTDALESSGGRRATARDSPAGQHFTGWVR